MAHTPKRPSSCPLVGAFEAANQHPAPTPTPALALIFGPAQSSWQGLVRSHLAVLALCLVHARAPSRNNSQSLTACMRVYVCVQGGEGGVGAIDISVEWGVVSSRLRTLTHTRARAHTHTCTRTRTHTPAVRVYSSAPPPRSSIWQPKGSMSCGGGSSDWWLCDPLDRG